MLDGWYCRSIANMQADEAAGANGAAPDPPETQNPPDDYSSDSSRRSSSECESETNYRDRYLIMKTSLKYLIYVSSKLMKYTCIQYISLVCDEVS